MKCISVMEITMLSKSILRKLIRHKFHCDDCNATTAPYMYFPQTRWGPQADKTKLPLAGKWRRQFLGNHCYPAHLPLLRFWRIEIEIVMMKVRSHVVWNLFRWRKCSSGGDDESHKWGETSSLTFLAEFNTAWIRDTHIHCMYNVHDWQFWCQSEFPTVLSAHW